MPPRFGPHPWLALGLLAISEAAVPTARSGGGSLELDRRSAHAEVAALDDAERAVALAPGDVAALRAAAEARARLDLTATALAAWVRTRALAESGGSADPTLATRATAEISALSAPSQWDLWQAGERVRFERAAAHGDEAMVGAIARRFPLFARLLAEEELFPAWARAAAEGRDDEARGRLAALRTIGAAFAAGLRDRMLADAIAALAPLTGERRRAALAGLDAFGRGMAIRRGRAEGDAGALLETAARKLLASGIPFAGWARFYAASLTHWRSSTRADDELALLEPDIDPGRYPALAGRIHWLRGIDEVIRERPEAALGHYEQTYQLLTRSEGVQSAGFVHLLLSEAYAKLGDRERTWLEARAALAAARSSGEMRARFSVLYQVAEVLLSEGYPWAARAVARELTTVARAWGLPSALAEAAIQRGRVDDRLGDPERARASFADARTALARVPMAEQRERIGATLEMMEGRAALAVDPEHGIELLTRALARQREIDYHYQEAGLLASRAAAERRLGRIDRARADLEAAIEVYEGKRGATRDEALRKKSFEEAQAAFDAAVALAVEERGDALAGLSYAERSRARLTLDLLSGRRGGIGSRIAPWLEPERIVARWPREEALVEFAVLPDRLFAFLIHDGALSVHIVPISAQALESDVARLETAVRQRTWSLAASRAAADLYDALLRTSLEDLPRSVPLSIAPDRFLARLPFAALLDRRTGRFVAEDRATTIVPSAALALYLRAAPPAATGDAPWLFVGDPAFDGARPELARLDPLPESGDEARTLARARPNARLLTGADATRERFLAEAQRASRIHIAAHALFDAEDPGRSRLVLAPDRPGADGALSARDIARLDLSQIELVVLSVCQGAAGGDAGRENVSGLAAAFLAAGARTVVASLWNVRDAKGRLAMEDFYRQLARDRSPRDAAHAITAAALRTERRADARAGLGFAVYGSGL